MNLSFPNIGPLFYQMILALLFFKSFFEIAEWLLDL